MGTSVSAPSSGTASSGDATLTRRRHEGKWTVDYARLERLVIGVGAAAIVGTAIFALVPTFDAIELVAQLLLLVVLVGAVRWGRRGGTYAAIAAIVVYIALKWVTLPASGVTSGVLGLVAARTVAYALLGVLGGEACSRMRDTLARAHGARAIDESSAYTPQFLARLLTEAAGGFERYNLAFSVLVIGVDGRVTSGMGAAESGQMMRTIATRLRRGLRLVDELGRLPWAAFAIILPQTASAGAYVAADRLRADLREELRIEDAAITVRVLSAAEDLDAIKTLAEEAAQSAEASD
jgi:GGDEF domain-containing protein